MNIDFTLNDFSGPLDLLLHLIKESKMNIFDIQIEQITNQYLEYIEKMEQMNLTIASSYLVMASELIEMKSKLLLPRHEEENESEEEEDPRENLIQRLLEYQQYKEITKTLKEKENERHEVYTEPGENLSNYVEEHMIKNSDVSLDDLVDAFQKFLQRQKENRPLHTKVTTKEISIEERRRDIKKILKEHQKISFFKLFDVLTKEYVVVTFLTILEMAKKGELRITQENNFDEIMCEVNYE